MLKHCALTEGRLARLLNDRLPGTLYPRRAPVAVEIFEIHGELIPYTQAVEGHFRPFSVGASWGGAWDTAWRKFEEQVNLNEPNNSPASRCLLYPGNLIPV